MSYKVNYLSQKSISDRRRSAFCRVCRCCSAAYCSYDKIKRKIWSINGKKILPFVLTEIAPDREIVTKNEVFKEIDKETGVPDVWPVTVLYAYRKVET
jgi:hypothetical protein